MKQKQNGSAHVILIGIVVVLISGALTYFLLKTLNSRPSTTSVSQQSDQIAPPSDKTVTATNQTYAEFSDWKVRFPTSTEYTLKRNSGTGSMATYYISIDSLAQTCTNPSTPWLGLFHEYSPNETVQNGPAAGKTFEEIYGKEGITINGKLYVFNVSTNFCTRNTANPAIEQAAEKLKSEIQNLEAY